MDAAIDVAFGFRRAWLAYARDAAREPWFVAAISGAIVQEAVALLADRQQQTVEAHYGVPVPLLALLDGYERFGSDPLPSDALRPFAPRHRMDGVEMWFLHAAFAEACVRRGIGVPFWTFMMRPILCGLLNDGLFRGRFTVVGFEATDAGRDEVFASAQSVADADLPGEIRRRFAESGLGGGVGGIPLGACAHVARTAMTDRAQPAATYASVHGHPQQCAPREVPPRLAGTGTAQRIVGPHVECRREGVHVSRAVAAARFAPGRVGARDGVRWRRRPGRRARAADRLHHIG